MANVTDLKVPQTTFNIGGKERTIKFDLNAFAEIESRYGKLEKAFAQFEKGDLKAVKMLIWAGLIHEEAVIDENTGDVVSYNITPYQVGSWIDPMTMKDIAAELGNSLLSSLPENQKQELLAKIETVDGEVKN